MDQYSLQLTLKTSRSVVVLMDTTYWERNFGVMLFKDAYTGENLLKYDVETETNELYKKGIHALLGAGYQVKGLVCDGLQSFDTIPIQMCQFHQAAIIRR